MSTAKAGSKAAKILAAADDLFSKQGFRGVTMSTIAQRAHVGKGTAYLYWRSKEELLLELVARHLQETLSKVAEQLKEDTSLAMPNRLLPLLAETWLEKSTIRALQTADEESLGALFDNPTVGQLFQENNSRAIISRLLPIWRQHGVVKASWTEQEQQLCLEMLLLGFFTESSHFVTQTLGHKHNLAQVLDLAISAVLAVATPSSSAQSLSSAICKTLTDQAQAISSSYL